jgi:hypothetical protein
MLLVAAALGCGATTPYPGQAECGVLDRVVEAAAANPSMRPAALEIFERIAEERMVAAAVDIETKVGFRAGELHISNYRAYEVRSCALRDIAKLDMPEALAYLESLKREQFDDRRFGRQVWSSAEIALREAQLNRLPDESAQVRFLENTTAEKTAAWWAVQELCNRGSYQSLPFIRQHITTRVIVSQNVDRDIRFCQQRMDLISRDPDRVKALASLLSVRSGLIDSELLGWAINQLRDMNSPRADAELDRFADEIDDLPDGSSRKNELWGRRVQIRGMLPPPRRK